MQIYINYCNLINYDEASQQNIWIKCIKTWLYSIVLNLKWFVFFHFRVWLILPLFPTFIQTYLGTWRSIQKHVIMRLPNNLKANIPPFITALRWKRWRKKEHIVGFSTAIFSIHTKQLKNYQIITFGKYQFNQLSLTS